MAQVPRQDTLEILVRQFEGRIEALESNLPIVYELPNALTTFAVEHGRGRVVGVQLYDNKGIQFSGATIDCSDPNTAKVTTPSPFVGTVVII